MPKRKQGDKSEAGETHKEIDLTLNSINDDESDSNHNHVIVLQSQAIIQKLLIATNILTECRDKTNRLFGTQVMRLAQYTKLPVSEIKLIGDTFITRDTSFITLLKELHPIIWPINRLLRHDIRNIFFKFMEENNNFPSKDYVLSELKTIASKYCYEILPIHRLIKNKLIKWEYFPKCNRYLLMEHPENVYQRTMYLKQIQEYRTQGRNFVYIEVRKIIPDRNATGLIVGFAVITHTNKFERFFTKDTADTIAKKWLQQRILPNIPEGSVVVFSQPKNRKKLTPLTKRTVMVSWLEDHGIPYRPNAHTAELYALYKRFRSKFTETEVYDHIFLNVGLQVIHCPEEWRDINYFQEIWKEIGVRQWHHGGKLELLKQQFIRAAQIFPELEKAEATLIENECKMLEEDFKMEKILENVLEMVRKGEVQVLDFPKDCCPDKTDLFETHVGDFILFDADND